MLIKPLAPYWEESPNFKAKEHVFFLSLKEGTQDELNTLVSKIHEPRLDLSKPLWRCFFIDGLSDNRFAIYFSFHHSLLDGISAGKIMERTLSYEVSKKGLPPFFAMTDNPYNKESVRKIPTLLDKLLSTATSNAKAVYGLTRISTQLCLEAAGLTKNAISLPFTAATTPLTGNVTSKRALTTSYLPMGSSQSLT